jgi:hypothetical protein
MIFIPCSDLQNLEFMAYWIVYVMAGHLASATGNMSALGLGAKSDLPLP